MANCSKCGAELKLGKKFCTNCGEPAIEQTLKTAEPTDAAEQFKLGFKYFSGNEVPKDLAKALYWFTKAAKQGYDLALELVNKIKEIRSKKNNA
jgi:predicted amidophosphoribosyltransferase